MDSIIIIRELLLASQMKGPPLGIYYEIVLPNLLIFSIKYLASSLYLVKYLFLSSQFLSENKISKGIPSHSAGIL